MKRNISGGRKKLSAICLAAAVVSAPATGQESAQFDCVIDPAKILRLGSSVMGVLDKVIVGRGDEVRKGETVALLNASVERATLAIAKAQADNTAGLSVQEARLDYAKRQYDRALQLQVKGVIPGNRFEELKANFDIAEQEMALARHTKKLAGLEYGRALAALDLRTIKSPIDGVVRDVERGPGEYVFQDASIMTVVQMDPLFVETFVPVHLYDSISASDMASVSFDQPSTTVVEAEVLVIDRVFDAASGTVAVRLKLPNPAGSIPAGLRCRVTF